MGTISDMDKEGSWTMVIRPRRKWLDFRLGELWRARDLIRMFVKRDFAAQYKQTVLGPVWFIVQPLLTTLVFTIIFGNVAKLPSAGLPHLVFYMTGTTIWNYFVTCFIATSSTFSQNAPLFSKVYFPRLAIPLAIVISNLLRFAIQFVLLLAVIVYYIVQGSNVHMTTWLATLPLLLLMMAGFSLGGGILVAALAVRYRDLHFLISFGLQLFMFATPIIYSLSDVTPKKRLLLIFNPLAPVVEGFRKALLGSGWVDGLFLLYGVAMMILIVFVGLLVFNRVENTFIDVI